MLRGEPTELCDGNYHLNKNNSLLVEWHDIPSSKVYGVPIIRSFFHRKWTLKPIFYQNAKLLALGTFASANAKDSTFALPNAKNTNMLVFLALGEAHFSRFTRRETEKLRFTRRQPPTPASGI